MASRNTRKGEAMSHIHQRTLRGWGVMVGSCCDSIFCYVCANLNKNIGILVEFGLFNKLKNEKHLILTRLMEKHEIVSKKRPEYLTRDFAFTYLCACY